MLYIGRAQGIAQLGYGAEIGNLMATGVATVVQQGDLTAEVCRALIATFMASLSRRRFNAPQGSLDWLFKKITSLHM